MNLITLSAILILSQQAIAQTNTTDMGAMPSQSPGTDMRHSDGGLPHYNDGQIATIVKTANDVDIKGGRLAKKRAHRTDVRKFAQLMINDHSAANRKLDKIVSDIGLNKTETDDSRKMKDMAKATTDHLKSVKKRDFDYEYIQSELAMHQQVLTDLENNLIPQVKNDNFRKYLNEVHAKVSDHLERAKKIDTAMSTDRTMSSNH
jgi:putative membrane protein